MNCCFENTLHYSSPGHGDWGVVRIGMLLPEDFYLQQNRDIYETIYSMFNYSMTIDPVTVLENMMAREGLAGEKMEAETTKNADGTDIKLER